jgi:hypothetical protein
MCLPALAVLGMGLSAAGGVMNAVGSYYSAKQANLTAASQARMLQIQQGIDNTRNNLQITQLKAQASTARQQGQIATYNAETALSMATANSDSTLALASINNDYRSHITDMNVSLAESISNFNTQIADGQAALIVGKGAFQASMAERNARIAEDDAQNELVLGQKQEQGSRLNYARLKSTQRASLAANGVALDEGSALHILTDTDYLSDVDADTIHANAVRSAFGYRVEAQGHLLEADFARANAAAEAFNVKAQAMGAKMQTDRDIINMKLSTSFEIMQSNANAAITAANIRQAGATTAANQRIGAFNFNAQAQAYDLAAASSLPEIRLNTPAARADPTLALAGGLLNTAGQVATRWYSYAQAGTFG